MESKIPSLPASVVDLLVDAVFAVDANANIVFASTACERIFGYTPQEMIGKNMFDMMLPEDRERTRKSVGEVMAGRPQLHFENRYVRKNGQIVHIMWSARWSQADQLRIGVARDITERKHAESLQKALYSISEAAHAAEDLLALFERIHQIVGTLLPANNFSAALYDEATGRLSFPYHVDEHEYTPKPPASATGTLYAEIIRTGQPVLLTPEAAPAHLKELKVGADANSLCWLGVPLKSHSGTIGVLVVKSYPGGVPYSAKDQELLQFISTQIATVIERQQMQTRLQHMAQYDQLTSLPNRRLLYERLNAALSTAQRKPERFALLYIDLDKFKQVNDTLGHSVGDLLLQEVGKRLTQCVRKTDTVARVGGDEFVVLLHDISLLRQAAQMAKTISHALSRPLLLDGHSVNIVPSIGIALYPEHGDNEQTLLNYADKAMYSQKTAINARDKTGTP
jgi:diguanylate cyclase (GGDEF)-like protein/PAS domain S-box-containing protein